MTNPPRKDYILRLIEQCAQMLAQILGLVQTDRDDEALVHISATCEKLLGSDDGSGALLIDRLARGEPPRVARDKALLFAALLQQAGNIYARKSRQDQAHTCRVNALALTAEALTRYGQDELPGYAPRIAELQSALARVSA